MQINVGKYTEDYNRKEQITWMSDIEHGAVNNSDGNVGLLFGYLKQFWFLNEFFAEGSLCHIRNFAINRRPDRVDYVEFMSARLDQFSIVPCMYGLQFVDADHKTYLTVDMEQIHIIDLDIVEDDTLQTTRVIFDMFDSIRIEMVIVHFE